MLDVFEQEQKEFVNKKMDRWGLLNLMKNQKKFLTETEITKLTNKTQPSVNRMLRSLNKSKKILLKKKPQMLGNSKRMINHYKYRG